LESLGRLEEALHAFDRATEINPGDFDAWFSKAPILSALGKHEAAKEALDMAFKPWLS
jgi:tetratricopeptide (TPR) repeat protein